MGPALPAAALLLVGIGVGAKGKELLRAAAPRVGRATRPFVKATIRGGYVLTRVGRVPAIGETFSVDGLQIQILEAERRRIHKVRIRRLPEPAPEAGQ